MRAVRWLSVVAVLGLAGCHPVSRQEYDDFKASVKASGEALDTWVDQAQKFMETVAAQWSAACPGCTGPTPPPPPPPNGDWGS